MKRLLLVLILSLALLIPTPASADTAEWGLCGGNGYGGSVNITYTIDTNSLQVDSFNGVNTTTEPLYMYIMEDGVLIFDFLIAANSTDSKPISQFKFRRIPATDHDDPNSVRYPTGVSIFCRWPAF